MNAHGQKSEANSFDPMTFRGRSVLEFRDDGGFEMLVVADKAAG